MIIELILFLIISIVLSSVGLGGGAFYVPLFLALGYPFNIASSTSLFLIMVTGASAFSRFQRAKLVDWQLAIVMDTFTDLGAFIGGFTAVHFAVHYLKIAFALVLLMAAIFIFRMQQHRNQTVRLKHGFGYWQRQFGDFHYSVFVPAVIPLTFAIGYLSGALGIAGGLLKIPMMVIWFNIPVKIAVATSSLMVGLTGLLGFSGHLFTGKINWLLCLGIGVVVFVGGQIGSAFSIKLPERKVKKLLAVILIVVAVALITRTLNGVHF